MSDTLTQLDDTHSPVNGLTNFEKWKLLLADTPAPDSYIEFGFYFLISAALQRRVWMGDMNPNLVSKNIFPPLYVILVGPPGMGKGQAMGPVMEMLRYWRFKLEGGLVYHPSEEEVINNETSQPLFMDGPQDLTYEHLITRQAKSFRMAEWAKCREGVIKPEEIPAKYGYSPMYFSLEELDSLFAHDNKRIPKYLLQAYDCNDFERGTQKRGSEIIRKPCLSFIAGTTPENLSSMMDEKFIGSGLGARIWFICEIANNKRVWKRPSLSEEQLAAKKSLLEHVKRLYYTYGQVTMTQEADDYCREWWEKEERNTRVNNHPKLAYYYERKIMHLKKMCMILLFAEQTTNYIVDLALAKKAMEILANAEKRMHYALMYRGNNPLAPICGQVLEYLFKVRKPVTKGELMSADGGGFFNDVNFAEMDEIIKMLTVSKKITVNGQGELVATALLPKKVIPLVGGRDNKIPGADLPALPVDPNIGMGA